MAPEKLTGQLIHFVEALEAAGFQNPHSFREGPCGQCGEPVTLTYWIPDRKEWLCADCVFGENQ